MLALKINITKFIKQEERDRIFKYSKSLAECYNLALNELKANNDFNAIHPLTKKFQNEHKKIIVNMLKIAVEMQFQLLNLSLN